MAADSSAEDPAGGAATPPLTAASSPAPPPAADDATPIDAAPDAVPSASAAPTAMGSSVPSSSGAATDRNEDIEEIPRAPRREEGVGPFRVAFGCVRGQPAPEFIFDAGNDEEALKKVQEQAASFMETFQVSVRPSFSV